jgi:hypothetical protein
MTETSQRLKAIENVLERHRKELVALRERSGRDWEEMFAVVDRKVSEGGGGTMDYIADFDEGAAIQAARSVHANLLLALDASGEFPDSVIKESSVTQHQAALSITAGQVTGLDYYTDADVDAHLSGGDGINYSAGSIAVDGTVLRHSDVDDTPVNGETDVPVSSNWAYDHAANAGAHHAKYTDEEAQDAVGAMVGNSLLYTDATPELDTVQDIRTTAAPTFTDMTLNSPSNIYALSHDSFADFSEDEHVDHTSVSISAGGILSGGGDISANRTISLNHSDVDHDQTTNFVESEHVDHTGVNLTAGDGLTGGGTIESSRSFAVGAGNGITVNADDVEVDQAYGFTWTSEHTFQADIQLDADLDFIGSQSITASGNLTLAPTGNVVASTHIIPSATDTYDLGSATHLWRKGWLSELDAIWFAQNSVQVTGGWWMVPHGSGTLAEGVSDSTTLIDFGSALSVGDFILLRGNGNVEYMEVMSDFFYPPRYAVTRDLDGSGANEWPQGHVWVNLGQSGDGRIEFDAQTQGPRIMVITQGATYNAQTSIAVLGDLNGWGPYSSTTYGFAFGDYSGGDYISWDPTNGVTIAADGSGITNIDGGNIQTGTVTATQISVSQLSAISADMGTLTAGEIQMYTGTWDSDANGFRLNSTEIAGQNDGDDQVYILASDGKLYAGGGYVWLDANGVNLTATSGAYQDYASIHFYDASDNETAVLSSAYFDAPYQTTRLRIEAIGKDATYDDAMISLTASGETSGSVSVSIFQRDGGESQDGVYMDTPRLCVGNGVAIATGTAQSILGVEPDTYSYVYAKYDLRVGYGLYVGSVSTDPAAGTITATDYVCALGGLHVGGTSDPGTDNLVVDGYATVASYLTVDSYLQVDGEIRQGGSDYGGYEIQTGGQLYVHDYGVFIGGVHVGGTSDPGTDNLVVDGEIRQGATDYGDYGIQTGGNFFAYGYLYVNDYGVFLGGLHVGGESDPGADNLLVDANARIGDKLYINETANGDSTVGLTINQGGYDDNAITLKSSDVAHGMTAHMETDTYLAIGKRVDVYGGAVFHGLTEEAVAVELRGYYTTGDTSKSTSTRGAANFEIQKKDGNSTSAAGSNEALVTIRTYGSTQFIFDREGDFYRNGSDNNYDSHDDAQLCRALALASNDPKGIIHGKFDKFVQYNRDDLIALGILGEDTPDGGCGLLNVTRLQELHNGAIWQLYTALQVAIEEIVRLGGDPGRLSLTR